MSELNGHEYELATLEDFEPQVEWVQLPSMKGTKKAVQLKKPDILNLIKGDGDVPDLLSSIVLAQVNGKKTEVDLNKDTLPQLVETFDVVLRAAWVAPELTEKAVRGMDLQDKAYVVAWALGMEYVPAERFRQEPGANVEPVQKVQTVRPGAKRRNRHT